ncbi:hypothetical protein HNQ34_002010 [Anoxybacillus tepidamans]|uniref:Uncharacterized protein n=1 Tax=Anoxybacteroides tepidamans TaxID=265948 RepID=A0A7W8MUV4_9BACL|nr:hypothetical protein [Anoxybacillus tepidamans]MBB5324912.1 hypothetical protein [Anoxybacillus tepidamans]
MNIKDSIHSFIDKIFNPPITFLDMAIEKLRAVRQITAQGLNVGKYLSIFGDMPTAWQLVISSALMSVVILGSLLIFRSVMRLYYSLKEGVKWW